VYSLHCTIIIASWCTEFWQRLYVQFVLRHWKLSWRWPPFFIRTLCRHRQARQIDSQITQCGHPINLPFYLRILLLRLFPIFRTNDFFVVFPVIPNFCRVQMVAWFIYRLSSLFVRWCLVGSSCLPIKIVRAEGDCVNNWRDSFQHVNCASKMFFQNILVLYDKISPRVSTWICFILLKFNSIATLTHFTRSNSCTWLYVEYLR
jgi:hypothetical protein